MAWIPIVTVVMVRAREFTASRASRQSDASCNGSCDCTYDYTCDGCTLYDGPCRGYGTCGIYPCRPIP